MKADAEVADPSLEQAKFVKTLREFGTYIRANAGSIPNYGERYRAGEVISTRSRHASGWPSKRSPTRTPTLAAVDHLVANGHHPDPPTSPDSPRSAAQRSTSTAATRATGRPPTSIPNPPRTPDDRARSGSCSDPRHRPTTGGTGSPWRRCGRRRHRTGTGTSRGRSPNPSVR